MLVPAQHKLALQFTRDMNSPVTPWPTDNIGHYYHYSKSGQTHGNHGRKVASEVDADFGERLAN